MSTLTEENFWESEELMSEEEASVVLSEENPDKNQNQEEFLEETVEEAATEVQKLEEEDEDPSAIAQMMSDARLRLEQGRLYEMLLEHNLFQDVQANPIAIKNVEKEIKKFIRERLEVLLGLREDPRLVKVSSNSGQFTPFEVDFLKKLIDRTTNGISKQIEIPPTEPKKVTGSIRPVGSQGQVTLPLAQNPAQNVASRQSAVRVAPPKPKVQPSVPAHQPMLAKTKKGDIEIPAEDESPLQKPAHKMTRSELMERNKRIAERQAKRKSFAPDPNRLPMPTPDQAMAISVSQSINRMANGKVANGTPLAALINKVVSMKSEGDINE